MKWWTRAGERRERERERAGLAKCEMCPALSNRREDWVDHILAAVQGLPRSPRPLREKGLPPTRNHWHYHLPCVPADSISQEPDFTDTSELKLKPAPMKKN